MQLKKSGKKSHYMLSLICHLSVLNRELKGEIAQFAAHLKPLPD
jgi:hypothetical protein